MSLQQMLFGWAAVSGAMLVGFLLLLCIAGALTPKRRQYFPSSVVVWTEVEYGVEVEYTLDEVLEMALDDGEALLESDRNVGKVYPLPKERAA